MRSLVKAHASPSPSSPSLKGGEILQPSPLEGEEALLMNSLVIRFAINHLTFSAYIVSSDLFTLSS
jgi:hypothetical protein